MSYKISKEFTVAPCVTRDCLNKEHREYVASKIPDKWETIEVTIRGTGPLILNHMPPPWWYVAACDSFNRQASIDGRGKSVWRL